MDFARKFPAATWFWRKATSRLSRNIGIGLLAVVLLVAVALRIEAALFAYRAHRVLFELSQLQSGRTTRSELLQKIPALHPAQPRFGVPVHCEADECLDLEMTNSKLTSWMFLHGVNSYGESFYSVLSWVGIRGWTFRAWVEIKSNVVSGYSYGAMLSDGSTVYPAAILIEVSEVRHFDDLSFFPSEDESPNYKVGHYPKWAELSTDIIFTKDVSPELKEHAFDVRLECLWSLRGCRTANQLLPLAEEDRLRINRATEERLRSDNPCPERILVRRARDMKHILLMEVASLEHSPSSKSQQDQFAKLLAIKPLKGELDDRLLGTWVKDTLDHFEPPIKNPAIRWIRPGERVLLFSDSRLNVDAPCGVIPATDTAVNIIERELLRTDPASQ